MQQHTKGLIWLASYPKSGNTWTRAFLHNLLAIMRKEHGGSDWDINRMNEFSTATQGIGLYETLSGKKIEELTRDDIAALRGRAQMQALESSEGFVFVKTHNGLMLDRGHPTINFEATSGAVYILRNPLDVAVSYSHHLGLSIDQTIRIMGQSGHETKGSAKQIHEVMGSWSEHVMSWAGKPHRAMHVMRYEDMVADPLGQFGALTRFLLLSPSREELDNAIAASSFEALKKQEEEKGFRERPDRAKRFFRAGKAGQWQDVLTPAQARLILHDHGEVMERFGYPAAALLRQL